MLLGAVFGVGSLLVARSSSKLVTPDDATLGLAKLAVVSSARMLVVMAALAAYFFVARPGFVPFAVTLVSSFLATLAYEALKVSTATRGRVRSG